MHALLLLACRPPAPVAPIATLSGWPFDDAVAVPAWVAVPGPDEPPVAVAWFRIGDGRVYVDQTAGGEIACRLYDPRRHRFELAEGCVETAFVQHAFEPLGDGTAVASSWGEGCGQLEVVSYDDGPRVLLSLSLGCAGGAIDWTAVGGNLVMRSTCDLDRGGCGPTDPGGPTRDWMWSKHLGLVSAP